jgi:hypothetical protein
MAETIPNETDPGMECVLIPQEDARFFVGSSFIIPEADCHWGTEVRERDSEYHAAEVYGATVDEAIERATIIAEVLSQRSVAHDAAVAAQ